MEASQNSLKSDRSNNDDDRGYDRDDNDNKKHHHDKLQTCQMITGEGVSDFRNSNKLNVEFSGDICPQKLHSSGDLDLTITGGAVDFAGASGDGNVSLVIGKKYFAGKLLPQVGGDTDLIVLIVKNVFHNQNPPQLIIIKNTNNDNTLTLLSPILIHL